MEQAACLGIFDKMKMIRLNRYMKYKKVHGLADVTMADGIKISSSALDQSPGESSRLFPIEKLTKSDW